MIKAAKAKEKRPGKPPRLANVSSYTKLYQDDYREVGKLCRARNETESEVMRFIVSDWMRANRVRSLGRDESTDPIRAVYERVVSEQIAPLTSGIEELKHLLAGKPAPAPALPAPPAGPAPAAKAQDELRGLIEHLSGLVEQTAVDLAESDAQQREQLERLASGQLLTNSLTGETFAAAWAIKDWVIRFLVEVAMLNNDKNPDDIDREMAAEKLVVWREASRNIEHVQDALRIPDELRVMLSELLLHGGAHSHTENAQLT